MELGLDKLAAFREERLDFPGVFLLGFGSFETSMDVAHDAEDAHRRVDCPALVCWGGDGVLPSLFDLPTLWGPRLARMACATVPGGHFFVDQHPRETAAVLAEFLGRC